MELFFDLYLSGLIIESLGTDKEMRLSMRKMTCLESIACRDQLAKFP